MQAGTAHESALGRLTLRTPKPESDTGKPMFRSMDAALSFAYTWRARPGVKIGQIGEYTGPDGAALLLSVHEKKAQAQYVHDVIESHLSLDQRAILDATYGGERGERHAGVERLVCLLEGAHRNRTMVRMLVAREFVFGEAYCWSMHRIARECATHTQTVSRAAAKVAPTIADLRRSTHEKLRPAFERRCWIPREAETQQ